ncbi:putative phospho-2-dehydro-3-deoxyheptonate aldolase (aroG)/chorismate mutase (pheA) [Candidatus Uzinura diaspidicola str. ASNER]|uniref:chorismate mutase n=1 Tax=Candidatus Uzinura diaspidicola str. ASNER TaxID=1133592 RepID=L7VFS8_9FLAO|nr:putative phospho-2-dehydro-3-deoxyheptonate aldolase (aroG)/chorismate mutase (pheA) [Candidatus Uzinura diaspidicola str. ASNER]
MQPIDKINNDWILQFKKPLIIAGPCSAETQEQVLETASKLSKASIPVFRAGIWKPRTKPGNFEGIGEIGLKWLQKVKEETGMLIATEVANATHVKYAIAYNIDILWIGARSTVNPFSVQEIAESLKDTDKIILIKNPIHPDFDLLKGAIERLIAQGIKNIGVIHRGFSAYKNAPYRNSPNWRMALDFIIRFPNIPILFDPSHICGQRKGISKIAQQALNCALSGLMIETHCSPDKAWSDAKQQITPEKLLEILKCIEFRNKNTRQKLEVLLLQIDEQDHHILSLLSERFKLSTIFGKLKKNYNLPIVQHNRWEQIIDELKPYIKQLDI